MRLYHLTAIALWHDEAFSALLIKYPFREMMQRIAADVHPPLYYIILRFWYWLFNDSLFSLRFFSVVFGLLTIWFLYLFIKQAFKNERLALLGAFLAAINPFQIQFSQEARMYTLGSFLLIFSTWLLYRAIEEKKLKWWLAYGISAGLALETHYFLIFSVAGQAIFVLAFILARHKFKLNRIFENRIYQYALAGYLLLLAIFSPWIPIFIDQFNQVQESYWIPKISPSSIPNTLWKMFGNWETWPLPFSYNIFLGIFSGFFMLALIFVILDQKIARDKKGKWLVVASFLIPFLLAIALSFKRSLYLDRYFIFSGLFFLVILALFIEGLMARLKSGKIIASTIVLIITLTSLYFYFDNWAKTNPSSKTGMAGAGSYLNNNFKPGDKIYVGSSFIYFTFKFYNKTGAAPLLMTPGTYEVKEMVHFSGNALLNNEDILPELEKGIKTGDRIWLLWTTGFGANKPTIPQNWQQIEETGFEDGRNRGWIVATLYKTQ